MIGHRPAEGDMETGVEKSLRRLLDKSEIQDVLYRYARGVDRKDMELVRAAYHPDAYDDHGDYKGGIDGFVDYLSTRHVGVSQSMHFFGNCLVEFLDDDVALVETYVSRRRITPKGAATDLVHEVTDSEILARYIDRFERRNGEWRIARRVVAFEAVVTAARSAPPYNPVWIWSRRDQQDAVFQMRDEK